MFLCVMCSAAPLIQEAIEPQWDVALGVGLRVGHRIGYPRHSAVAIALGNATACLITTLFYYGISWIF